MGGCVAMAFGGLHPTRAEALGLIDTTAWYGPDAPLKFRERAEAARANGMEGLIEFQLTRWFSDEFRGAEWLDTEIGVGARFVGRNWHKAMGEWETISIVNRYDNLCNRYVNGVVYQVDCYSGFVEDVIPLYAGGYGVGQLLPSGYGYYNVPFAYRSYFNDDDDYYYRYAPGSIYRVDRETSLISAVVALLTNGLTVGQPLPAGYSAYNVPLAYRSTYYDTPDAWYRYDNGYIYAVDRANTGLHILRLTGQARRIGNFTAAVQR